MRLKTLIAQTVYKISVDTLILFYIIFKHQDKPLKSSNVSVYITVSSEQFALSILSMLSLENFIPGLQYKIISDGSLNQFHYFIYKKLFLNIFFITENDLNKISKKLKTFPYFFQLFKNSLWCGLKFTVPLLFNKKIAKIIVLDSDTLFFKFPVEISRWISDKSNSHFFIKDYNNFSSISIIEAEKILKHTPKIFNLDSGLMCISLKDYWKINSLKNINQYIKEIIFLVKNRMQCDYNTANDFLYLMPHIEQTLYWLTIDNCKAYSLNTSYYVLPTHTFQRKQIISSPKFVHFTEEKNIKRIQRALYKYLFFSLFEWLSDIATHKLKSTNPWFIYSKNVCPNCSHI